MRIAECVMTLACCAVLVASQSTQTWKVEVLLNGRHLMWAHTHVAPSDPSAGVDEQCVSQDDVARLLGGGKSVMRQGSNLDAVPAGATRRAIFRVQRPGRISSRLHRMGDEDDFPLVDFAQALGAFIGRDSTGRINLVLPKSDERAILALNGSR